MLNDLSLYKTSKLYFPKIHVIRARKKKNLNYFLNGNYNNDYHINYDYKSNIEGSNTDFKNTNKTNIFNSIIPKKLNFKNASSVNQIINRYSYRKLNEVKKTSFRKNSNNNKGKINKLYTDLLYKRNNSKLKNQGISTSDSFFTRNKTKINFRTLSLGKQENNMDNLSSCNQIMKEFRFGYLNLQKNKNKKSNKTKNNPLTEGFSTKKLKKDKYAYIYMSEKSELIKHLRRLYYNPLNV